MKKYDYEEMTMLNKEDLIEELEDCYNEIENLADMEYLVDIDDLKEKLEFYGLKSEELWNFFGDYERLYQYK